MNTEFKKQKIIRHNWRILCCYVLLLLLTGCNPSVPMEYEWLQGEWISDAELTISQNLDLRSADDEKFRNETYGQMKWTFNGDNLEFQRSKTERPAVAAVEYLENEIIMKDENSISTVRIWKVQVNKFCSKLLTINGAIAGKHIECFARTST